MIDSGRAIRAYTQALQSAGVSPRDVEPLLGLSRASQYRIMAGSSPTMHSTIVLLVLFTKFLRWVNKRGFLEGSLKKAQKRQVLEEAFDTWVSKD